ncbi:MAG: archaeosortase/exosortase family protein [Burkholderiaceae bacterium]
MTVGQFDSLFGLVFFSALILLGLLELPRAFAHRQVNRGQRWTSNAGLFLLDGVAASLVIPVGIVAFAAEQPPGFLSAIGMPTAAGYLLTFLLLDLWSYAYHRMFHVVPVLWRLHLVHHSDTRVDITTSQRHHPLESALGAALMLSVVVLLGLPAPAIGIYLLFASAIAIFAHANLRLPDAVDRWLRLAIVTPTFHEAHHSSDSRLTDSNYGMVLTIWDRLFSSYTDPAKHQIQSYGLEYFRRPQDRGLWRTLLQPFLFRVGMQDSIAAAKPADVVAARSARALTATWRHALIGAAIGSGLVLLVMWPTALQLAKAWQSSESYRYGWLVVPTLVYLLGWRFRDEILACEPRSDFSGAILAVAAGLLWEASALMNIQLGGQIALVLALHAVAMCALGWHPYRRLFPILALLFLVVPSGDVLQPVLRLLTVKSIGFFTTLASLPHHIDGYSVVVGDNRYMVVDACSGLTYVTLMLFLGYSFGVLVYRSFVRILALAVLGAGLGFLANLIRVNAIVLVDWLTGSQMDLSAHGYYQWIGLAIAMGAMFVLLAQLSGDAAPVGWEPAASKPSVNWRRFAPAIAGTTVLLLAAPIAWMPVGAAPITHHDQIENLPRLAGGWELTTAQPRWSTDDHGATESLAATYRRDGRDMQLLVVQALSESAKLPAERLAPGEGAIWRDVLSGVVVSCAAPPCLTMVHTRWQRTRKFLPRHVFYAYTIGDFTTVSMLEWRALRGLNRLTANIQQPRLIGITVEGAEPLTDDIAAAFQAIRSAIQRPDRSGTPSD